MTDAQDGTVLTRENTGMRQKFSIRLWIMGMLLILGLLLPGSGQAQKAGAVNTPTKGTITEGSKSNVG